MYPSLRKDSKPFIFDGKEIDDPYQWIRDNRNPEVLEWVKEENEYTDGYFRDHQDIYDRYYDLNKAKRPTFSFSNISRTDSGYIATKYSSDEYMILELDRDFKTVRDITAEFKEEDTTFFSAALCPDDSNLMVIHGLIDGKDRPSLYLYDVKERKLLKRMDGIFSFAFKDKGKKILYGDAIADPENKISYTYLKEYDIDKDEEETIYAYRDNAITTDGAYGREDIVVIARPDYSNNIIFFKEDGEYRAYNEEPKVISYAGETDKGHIILSFDKSETGKVIAYRDGQEEVLFQDKDVYLKEACTIRDDIYIIGTRDCSSVLYRLNGGIHEIELPENCTVELANLEDPLKDELMLNIMSFTMPPTVFAIRDDKAVKIYADKEVDAKDIIVEKRFYPSQDGTLIPAFIVSRKDMVKDGSNPTLLYGYGGYNLAQLPEFHNFFIGMDVIDFVHEGGIYVNCCIRGGNEYGESWHLDGYKLKKKNCYYDFIGITEGVIRDGYTASEHIAICGGSNGGLLMGALVTMRPDLFSCVIASVPHTDMISFVNDDRGPMYITEYGDPHDEEQFAYFMSYSPFHNVKQTAYPACYIQTGECDNNVPPYHGKKFAARMQELNTSSNPILLRVLPKGSHDRGKGEYYLRTISEMQTFMAIALKLNIKENR